MAAPRAVGLLWVLAMASTASDLKEFVTTHQTHGTLKLLMGNRTPHGYWLEVRCPCRASFQRWVAPREAADDAEILGPLN